MQSTRQITASHDRVRCWADGLGAAAAKSRLWHRCFRTRRSLRELESHRLGDIGLTEQDRRREGAKWFWQA